jgi:hypothetical protein
VTEFSPCSSSATYLDCAEFQKMMSTDELSTREMCEEID